MMSPDRERAILEALGPGWSRAPNGRFVGPDDCEISVTADGCRARMRQRSRYADLGPYPGYDFARRLAAGVKEVLRRNNPPGRCW
jgi:hypothetical protein